ncbi:C-5 cytosine methyltransferase DmtA [Aspergillus sclerotialis]|uniref:DNA (cytosine-5-)-methyltransferase n=1 Tax=Aspergillus sclerotialis TaxID=2070753 RepID=A0A3A3A813_9EURO|nr:C-5 cytosine methyltransferase DmtA [Aspergillus sclerotialis]
MYHSLHPGSRIPPSITGRAPQESALSANSEVTLEHNPDYRYHQKDVIEAVAPASQGFGMAPRSRRPFDPQNQKKIEVIDLTSDEYDWPNEDNLPIENNLARLALPVVIPDEARVAKPKPRRADAGKRVMSEACVDGIIYKPGQSYKLFDGSYIRVVSILEDSNGIWLRGQRLFKLTHMEYLDNPKPYFPKWKKTLVWVVDENNDIPLGHIKRAVKIHFTNQIKSDKEHQENCLKQLFCCLKESSDLGSVRIEYLTRNEADEGYRSEPWELRNQWRSSTKLFGDSAKRSTNAREIIELDTDTGTGSTVVDLTIPETEGEVIARLTDSRQYTFADVFCGAGGMSSGAQKANLKLTWALDKSENAVQTYKLNFPDANCEVRDVFDFLTETQPTANIKVDICHGSPPCQTFSIAKTVASSTDDANFACIFSCADLIRATKPRVFTMEETSGLLEMNKHKPVFCRLVQSFLEIGYSVSWHMLHSQGYGVPQKRRRLIIIASGPGETLPPFPKPTHGLPGSGLLPYETINSVISTIPPLVPHHDTIGALFRARNKMPKRPYDGNRLAKTITSGGGEGNYHPSGKRQFTTREYASLQTFDDNFRFLGHEVLRQIGNAVPPLLAEAILKEVIKTLQETDRAEAIELLNRGIRSVDDL